MAVRNCERAFHHGPWCLGSCTCSCCIQGDRWFVGHWFYRIGETSLAVKKKDLWKNISKKRIFRSSDYDNRAGYATTYPFSAIHRLCSAISQLSVPCHKRITILTNSPATLECSCHDTPSGLPLTLAGIACIQHLQSFNCLLWAQHPKGVLCALLHCMLHSPEGISAGPAGFSCTYSQPQCFSAPFALTWANNCLQEGYCQAHRARFTGAPRCGLLV